LLSFYVVFINYEDSYFLNLAVFLDTDFGWLTNCLPALLPSALALLVADFSDDDNAFQAAFGKYLRLPSDGFPDDVVHSCLLHLDKLLDSDLAPL
jgi:hypothetical protein